MLPMTGSLSLRHNSVHCANCGLNHSDKIARTLLPPSMVPKYNSVFKTSYDINHKSSD